MSHHNAGGLGLRTTRFKTLVLSMAGEKLLTCSWKKSHSVAMVTYFGQPESRLKNLLAKLPDEALGTHLELMQICPWKDELLADESHYAGLFSVRDLVAIRHTYYALGQLASKLPESDLPLALKCTLAIDFEKISPYFLEGFPDGAVLADMTGIPPTLVLPLIVSCQVIPGDDRHDYVNLVQSFLGFFAQTNIAASDFFHEFIVILTKGDSVVSLPCIVFKLLSIAHKENFYDLLKTVSLYEYLAKLGHTIDLSRIASWPELTQEIRRIAQSLAEEICDTGDLGIIKDRRILDTFLLILPDYLLYQQSSRWNEPQKQQLKDFMKLFLQSGSISVAKYPVGWQSTVERMLTRQIGADRARQFVARWMTPQTIYTYDYTTDPSLKKEEINRLERLHAHVDLASFNLPIPAQYQHLITHPFTSTYYETKKELMKTGNAVPKEQTFLLLDDHHHAKIMFYKEQAEVRYDPTKPDSVFNKNITGLFVEAFHLISGSPPSDEELHSLEDMRERIAHMILGLPPSKEIPDLVETVLERCKLDRKKTPIDVQERLRKRLRESITQHRRQYKDFYDNILQYKLFRYFNDDPERKALLEAVVYAQNYEAFSSARTRLLSTINEEKNANLTLASFIGDNEIAYLRKLIYVYNFNRALKLFDYIVTKETRHEDPHVHDVIINYAKLLAHIKAANQKTSGADAKERLQAFVDLLNKNWVQFDQLLKQEGTNRALEYLTQGHTLIKENRDYLIEVTRNYLNNETRRIYARIELWDSDRFLDWITVTRTVYEPHVAHQKSCMHPDKINSRTGKSEYLMGYIRSAWVKQLYLGSKDLFDPFDENNKIRCILFLTPAIIDGQEQLVLNIQHPYPLNPTREAWRVLMEGARRLSSQYGLPLVFPNISVEELQHAAIQTRAKLFHQVSSKRINLLIPRGPHELQQRDDYEHSILPPARNHLFLGESILSSMITSKYWVIQPEGSGP